MSSANQFKCEQCGMTFGSQEEVQIHSNIERMWEPVEDLPPAPGLPDKLPTQLC